MNSDFLLAITKWVVALDAIESQIEENECTPYLGTIPVMLSDMEVGRLTNRDGIGWQYEPESGS